MSRRRLFFGLLAALASYTLTVGYLARRLDAFVPTPPEAEAADVVRQYFEALHQHHFSAAYQLLSPAYRHRVSYQRFLEVVTARRLGEAGEPVLAGARRIGPDWVLLEAFLPTGGGVREVQFVLHKDSGRWWIDLVNEWPHHGQRNRTI